MSELTFNKKLLIKKIKRPKLTGKINILISSYIMLIITFIFVFAGFLFNDFLRVKLGNFSSFNGLYLLFLLLGYLSSKHKLNTKYLLINALALTALCPILLITNQHLLATISAIYLFCFLATFVILEMIHNSKLNKLN